MVCGHFTTQDTRYIHFHTIQANAGCPGKLWLLWNFSVSQIPRVNILPGSAQAQAQLETEIALFSLYMQYGLGYMQYGLGYMQYGLGYIQYGLGYIPEK